MKASETHLGKILETTNQFVVPLFQRPYTWDESGRKVLWSDLCARRQYSCLQTRKVRDGLFIDDRQLSLRSPPDPRDAAPVGNVGKRVGMPHTKRGRAISGTDPLFQSVAETGSTRLELSWRLNAGFGCWLPGLDSHGSTGPTAAATVLMPSYD
jgi:hypothetical protein